MKAREWHAMRRYSKDGTFRFDSNMHAASFHRKANVIDQKKNHKHEKSFSRIFPRCSCSHLVSFELMHVKTNNLQHTLEHTIRGILYRFSNGFRMFVRNRCEYDASTIT